MTAAQSSTGEGKVIATLEDLLAHARDMEAEAAERYDDLADQMEVHNNHEVARLFRKLAEIEAKHIAAVEAMGDGLDLPELKPWEHAWENESPEAPEPDEVHYLMTPYHVISIALRHERMAVEFFESVVENGVDPKLRDAAEALAEDERGHVKLLEEWLLRFPKPEEGWDEDPDPPNLQE
jgi:rubrerythrin